MVAPIRATTGINTKLLVGLELGIPLVVSSAAAAPLGIGRIGSGARGGNGSFAPASTAHPLPLAALLADEIPVLSLVTSQVAPVWLPRIGDSQNPNK